MCFYTYSPLYSVAIAVAGLEARWDEHTDSSSATASVGFIAMADNLFEDYCFSNL